MTDYISRADAIEVVKHSTAYMHDDLKDGTLFVTVLDAEKVKKVFVNDLQGFYNTFCEEPKQDDDSDYDSLVPDEYKTEPSDLISRADAIDAIDDAIDADSPQWAILRTKIGFLPSTVRCKDCRFSSWNKYAECLDCYHFAEGDVDDNDFCSRGERREP